jgi:hypothetical protein
MMGLPSSIGNFFARRAQLKAAIANLRATPITVTATVPIDYYDYGDSGPAIAMDTSDSWARDALNAAEYEKGLKLGAMQRELSELDRNEAEYTVIVAYSTGLSYSGLPVWQCVGAPVRQ